MKAKKVLQKMSLENIQGKLSRKEMKNIMAGSGGGGGCMSYSGCSSGCISTTNGINGTCSYCCLA